MTVAVACVDSAAEPVTVLRRFSFLNRSMGKCTCVSCCCKSCETYTCHCLGFGKKKKSEPEGGMTFETDVAVPSVVLPPASRIWASATLSHSGHYHGVMVVSSIPQGIRGSNHSQGCLVFSGSDPFPHARRQANQKHCQKKMVVWAETVKKMLLEFSHVDAGLEALYLHGELEQLKIGLPFALSELPKQNLF
jgi:hypothetical protein